jgi:type IV secretion system protein VirD4
MSKPNEDRTASLILAGLGIVPVVWAALVVAPFLSEGLKGIVEGFTNGMREPLNIQWCANSPKAILLFLLLYGMGIGIYFATRQNYRHGEEHGSAKWGTAKEVNRKYADKHSDRNIILTNNVKIGLDGRKHRRNLNVLVVGGSGAGKTRFYAKPNIMQANTSFVALDPKGELLRDTGKLLESKGYEIRVLDLINPGLSHCYNPFAYLRDEKDVLKLVTNLIRNTTPKGAANNDPFWEKSETALLEALILYLLYMAPPEEQNFPMIMDLLSAAEVHEDDEEFKSILDQMFNRLEAEEPDNLAVKQYNIFKLAAGKTAKSILISLAVRLEKFNLPQIASITMQDDLDLASLGEKKVALFAVIPDNDSSLNYIVGMMYTQLFQELYYSADRVHNGRLPVHVHCVMDEFANVALPDEFDKLLATMRSREISVSIIIQNIAQLKALFDKQWESIIGNCDEFLYLGGNEDSTHELVSKKLGKETISADSYTESKGRNGSYSKNTSLTGRNLMLPDEVRMLDNRYALLFVRGENAVMDEKYDLMKHPNIARTTDGGAEPYEHGLAPFALDPDTIILDDESYVVLSSDEILEQIEEEREKQYQEQRNNQTNRRNSTT